MIRALTVGIVWLIIAMVLLVAGAVEYLTEITPYPVGAYLAFAGPAALVGLGIVVAAFGALIVRRLT